MRRGRLCDQHTLARGRIDDAGEKRRAEDVLPSAAAFLDDVAVLAFVLVVAANSATTGVDREPATIRGFHVDAGTTSMLRVVAIGIPERDAARAVAIAVAWAITIAAGVVPPIRERGVAVPRTVDDVATARTRAWHTTGLAEARVVAAEALGRSWRREREGGKDTQSEQGADAHEKAPGLNC